MKESQKPCTSSDDDVVEPCQRPIASDWSAWHAIRHPRNHSTSINLISAVLQNSTSTPLLASAQTPKRWTSLPTKTPPRTSNAPSPHRAVPSRAPPSLEIPLKNPPETSPTPSPSPYQTQIGSPAQAVSEAMISSPAVAAMVVEVEEGCWETGRT